MESPRFRFTAPIGPIEAEELSWYLERYINWPTGYFQTRAATVVQSLPQWGRLLYDTLNNDTARTALEAWKSATADRRFTIKVDHELIAGTPPAQQQDANEAATLLLGLPWELLHDERTFLSQGKRGVRVRRSLPNRHKQPALTTDPPIRVLLISPRPEDKSATYIDHRISARPLVEAFSQLDDLAHFHLLTPATFPALQNELIRAAEAGEPYHVVHFDGHGVYDHKHGLGMLCFEDPADQHKLEKRGSKLIDAADIAAIVRDHRVPLFFLEACQSAKTDTDPSASVAGKLLESGVSSVAAMTHSVLVETARLFITVFYQELLSGKRVGQAMLAGQRTLQSDTLRGKTFQGEVHLHDWFVPVLFQEEQDPQLIHKLPAKQVEPVLKEQQNRALGDLPPEPPHQFLGRSRDLLKGERILDQKPYLVVKGAGGEGKTTFAAELARWLVATRRFHRAAFCSVEQITERRQVLFSLGAQLVPNFAAQAGTDDELGRQLLDRAFREHPTLLVIDNMESLLDLDGLHEILDLCSKLPAKIIFTTREALPSPFNENVLSIGRLDRQSAIRLVGNVLHKTPDFSGHDEDIKKLVDAVDCHARSLVLIAREVGAAGVRHATENLLQIMKELEAKHPGQRENSLLASAELSLRRLPPGTRELIRPLSVFHGGGGGHAIAPALKLDQAGLNALARALIEVGLAEYVEPQYLRFDPAFMGADLSPDERTAAVVAWASGIAAEIQFLYGQLFEDPVLARNLTDLELPNSLAALEHMATREPPERVVDLATSLEQLVASLNRPKALARIIAVRLAATKNLGGWSHAGFQVEQVEIERLIDRGHHAEAVRAAGTLLAKASAVGDNAYDAADFDHAMAENLAGKSLSRSGNAQQALSHLEEARLRFNAMGELRMAGVAIAGKADCFGDLGRHNEAAVAYEQAIAISKETGDPRARAVSQGNLATVRMLQQEWKEALRLHQEARETFERLNEPPMVAVAWHQIGRVHESAGHPEAAEHAYQNSLNLQVQRGNTSGQATTLGQLGNLYASSGRIEDAVRLYRQTVDIFVSAGDLRSEGFARGNLADKLIKLHRHDEARIELNRAIECNKPFGHTAHPWKTFDILTDLERAVGNQPAAVAARKQALEAYLAYRRDGGAPEIDTTKLIPIINQDPAAARASVDDPETPYRMAAEILLALEKPPG